MADESAGVDIVGLLLTPKNFVEDAQAAVNCSLSLLEGLLVPLRVGLDVDLLDKALAVSVEEEIFFVAKDTRVDVLSEREQLDPLLLLDLEHLDLAEHEHRISHLQPRRKARLNYMSLLDAGHLINHRSTVH